MNKPKLVIEKRELNNKGVHRALGMSELLNFLCDSDLFDVSFHDEKVKTMKGHMGTIIYYEDKKIYLDVWEYQTPTYTYPVVEAKFDLIIKLQEKGFSLEAFDRACRRKGVWASLSKEERHAERAKITPWTFFASRMFHKFAGKEDQIENLPIENLGFFCGKLWKGRHKMKQRLEECGIEYTKSSQEFRSGRPLTDEEYIHKMQISKYGIVLAGRGSMFAQGKNRREIDYMMLKKPLLLNYRPYYYDPLIEGKHYIFIDEKTDFKNLENMYNIDEIANSGWEWYQRNASPMGVAQSFLKIMNDKFGK